MASPPSEDSSSPPTYDTSHIISPAATAPPTYDETAPPRDAPLTVHTYTLNPKPSTSVTLALNNSFAPSPAKMALFFLPGVIEGEVKLTFGKKVTIRKLSVFVSSYPSRFRI